MEVSVGLRVVRGQDWKWGDQDGGEGSLGTIAEIEGGVEGADGGTTTAKAVVVQWDGGNRCNYRCGIDGKYDLLAYDSGPVGIKHENIVCDSCRENPIAGIRWKCVSCYDFDLCTSCYHSGKHALEHPFMRIDKAQGQRVRLPTRKGAKRVMAKGIFPNAEVIRGHDWLWGDQDGGLGSHGKVYEIQGWGNESMRSVVEVEWNGNKKKNVYRVGHKGKVDIKCTGTSNGGYYYPQHMPVLGAPYEPSALMPESLFTQGDRVRVSLDIDVFKAMQDGHGGWNDQMAHVIAEVGTIQTVQASGDLRVRYSNGKVWTMNSESVAKVTSFSEGDVIRIVDDIATLHTLQENHGGWVDDMALSLGQAGRVVKVFPTGDIRVAVNGRVWTYNPQAMVAAPGENPPEIPDSADLDTEDIGLHLKLLSLLENPAVIVAAAAAGDASTLRDFLRKHPSEVNTKAAGKAAIHCACAAGNVEVLKVIMEFSPNVEVGDEDGDRPLHLCAYSDEDEATTILINAGADVNSKNTKGATPLIIAAVKGHYSVVRKLANNPNIKLHEQDSDGDTALHCAVLAQKNESVTILLDAGADPTLLNFRLFTPIHEAARIGFLPAVEHFNRRFVEHINLRKDDGYTPLHLSALNDHLDVITAFAEVEQCDLNAKTNTGQTALHLAVHQGHARIVERLVGYGVELNVQDNDGDTALHIALVREAVDSLSAETPQLKKVREQLQSDKSTAIISCFLVQEGAEMFLSNKKGMTPLQLCSPDVATIVMGFPNKETGSKFHGSLCAPTTTSSQPTGLRMQASGMLAKPLSVGRSPLLGTTSLPGHHLTRDGSGAAAAPQSVTATDAEPCFLCEAPVDVQFDPCGHAVMCSACAQRAKRCPTCKAVVKATSKLAKKCPMCSEEEATVTVRPCGHVFCPDCARRMRTCFDCRVQITTKEGLPPVSGNVTTTQADSGAGSPCPICLTEPRNTAFLCGHQLCWECAQKVDHCPVCRKFVTHRIQLFQ